MKYSIGGIVAAAAIVGIAIWIHGSPERTKVAPVEPTTPPPALAVDSAPAESTDKASTVSPAANAGQAPKALTTRKTKDGMTIEVTKEGSGEAIKGGQIASVQYTGMLADGTIFDATSKRGNQPFEFTVGAGQVIKGWDEGVLGMRVGESRRLIIPAELAYGAGGIPGVIPGGATLTFDVTLEKIK